MGIVSGKEAQRSVGPEEAVGSPRVPRRAGAQTSPTRIAANRVSRAPANPQTSSFPANPSSSHRPNAAKAAARERERPPGLSPPGTVCVWSRHSRSPYVHCSPATHSERKYRPTLGPNAPPRIIESPSPSPRVLVVVVLERITGRWHPSTAVSEGETPAASAPPVGICDKGVP